MGGGRGDGAYNLRLLGELITGLEKAFQNKLHSRADQNTFLIYSLQNVVTNWGGISRSLRYTLYYLKSHLTNPQILFSTTINNFLLLIN